MHKELEALNFPVAVLPVPHPTLQGENVKGRQAIVRTDTNEVLNIVSGRYPLTPHAQVFGPVDEAIDLLGIPVLNRRVSTAYQGGLASVVWTLDRKIRLIDGSFQDEMNINITARNSYNYSSLVSLEFGTYRLICTNGLSVGQLLARAAKRHVPSLSVPALLQDITAMVEKSEILEKKFAAYAEVEYSRERLMNFLEGQPISKNARQEIADYFTTQPDRAKFSQSPAYTGWEALNAITWFGTHRVKSRLEDTKLLARERVNDLAQLFARKELEVLIDKSRN